jgi:2-amino-4-hydroxy-6-hydroxymethyldihydropteridine diphosphokinase
MKEVFIGLGSNLDAPLEQLKKAVKHLSQIDNIKLINVSEFYVSSPMGPQDQPDYINAVAELETNLSAEKLLDVLQDIENIHGRIRTQRWGARTLDLDLLLYGSEMISTQRLTVPHVGIGQRNFVLYPLNDLVNENFNIPNLGTIKELLVASSSDGLQRLDV